MLRVVGALLFVLGSAGTVYSTWAMFHFQRPRDVAFAVAAPLALSVALAGLIMVFVPHFFG